MNVVESAVLINLDSVERNHLKLRKSGVDEALRQIVNATFNHWVLASLHKPPETDFVGNSGAIHIHWSVAPPTSNHANSCLPLFDMHSTF